MNSLKQAFKNYYLLNDISGILFWDNATNLPSKSVEARSEQMSILSDYIDRVLRSNDLLTEINSVNPSNLTEKDQKNLSLMKNIVKRENAVDPLLKSKLVKKKLSCEHLWREARENNNSSIIEKDFNDLLELAHEESEQISFATKLSPYDALISKYDMDYDSNKIDQVFEIIKTQLIPQYLDAEKITSPYIYSSNFDEKKILEQIKIKLSKLNFDFNRGRIDQSHHPFCGGATEDVRITTRFENNILETLSALFHETGHGVYEQFRPKNYLYEPIGQSRSLSVHESQSLFYENHIFKSKGYFNTIKTLFDNPEDLEKSFIDHYHKIRINPIRVSSDEFSYPIHVFIRYEIEKIIFTQKINFKDIRNLWNKYYKEFLAIDLTSDSVGVLQDIHWYEGIFGYFPTYALGAMTASQLKFNCAQYDAFLNEPNDDNAQNIAKWLNSNIHQNGSLYSSDEMLKNISGETLNSSYYLKHLTSRFF